MNITVIGVGYVGLVTGTCFAEMGNKVYCVDVDEKKIEGLKKGKIPIYEPGLDDMVKTNYDEGRLVFTTSLEDSMQDSNVYFIAVGTPMADDGSANLTYVFNVAKQIGENLDKYAVIVDKSTVPVGTAEKVHGIISQELKKRNANIDFDVVSNPEFLKEGAAIDDFMKPDRIIVGTDSDKAERIMRELYSAFSMHHDKFIHVGVRDAEMTKYTANAMLATKISFMNEISNICDRLDVDVENVRRGIGSDSRIGYSFIYPGVGYGGSCFPKDVSALVKLAQDTKFEPILLKSVTERNHEQKSVLFEKITKQFGDDLSGHTFGMWGLSFKPGTDDLREAPSRVLIE
ncbi:MAG: nucleotide sugar dehydrogenase, partial [Candidatus Marinimicrobia bacterium]|nr:nucleotide sugar dehydrogenase [Candidatus Neomarinimicrobiota bacterium]